jgi:hypothetical protein
MASDGVSRKVFEAVEAKTWDKIPGLLKVGGKLDWKNPDEVSDNSMPCVVFIVLPCSSAAQL